VSATTANQKIFTGPLGTSVFASNVAADSASLQATINPNGGDTHYYFEYGTTVAYGSYAPLGPPGEDIGTDATAEVLVHVQGLSAGTKYHYRLVVSQDGEVFDGNDVSLTTQKAGTSSTLLSDGRQMELVSPANKKGALLELFETGGQVQAADVGSGIAYATEGPSVTSSPSGHITIAPVLSTRDARGWHSSDLTLPGRLPENEEEPVEILGQVQLEYHLFSPSLASAVVEPQAVGTPPLSPEATERTLYVRDNLSELFQPLVTTANVPTGTLLNEPNFNGVDAKEWVMHFLAATPDLHHVVIKTPMALTAEAVDEEKIDKSVSGHVQWNIYEWSPSGLQLVNILPNGLSAHGRYPLVPPVRLAGMSSAGGLGRGGGQRDVSDDGRWVAWTWGEPYTTASLAEYRGLYVRDMFEEETVRVGGASAKYQTMNSDGSRIFYIEDGDLHEFDTKTKTQQDLTNNHGVKESAGVQETVADVSRDGSSVYFVATGVLAAGGISGEDNLYRLHNEEAKWTTTYIATLSPNDQPSWYAAAFSAPFLQRVSSRVSPDGRFLVFMSERVLTGYDNVDALSGHPDEEVYLYDSSTGKLACVSCNPTGARPVGVFDTVTSELLVDRQGVWNGKESAEGDKHTDHWLSGNVPGWDNLNNNPTTYQPRYLLNDGRVFFDSADALVATDTNGLEDVYEYEPVGVGDCVVNGAGFSEVASGCVGLMSSGTASLESAFYDASNSGDDVFFTTTAKLVGEDYDKGYDVYDAHVCSEAVPCHVESPPPITCSSGDSCKGAPTPQPEIFGPPPSATFSGAGNVVIATKGSIAPRLTRAQKLARAVKACKQKRSKRRTLCLREAHRKFDAAQKRRGKGARRTQG
jgi:hypothetical protein